MDENTKIQKDELTRQRLHTSGAETPQALLSLNTSFYQLCRGGIFFLIKPKPFILNLMIIFFPRVKHITIVCSHCTHTQKGYIDKNIIGKP